MISAGDHGEGPIVVLVHGSPVSMHTWRHVVPALSSTHRVLTPDLAGFGDSDPLPDGGTFPSHAEALGDWLFATVGDQPFDLVVHDWGGPVGLGAVCARMDQVRSVVMVNTTVDPAFRPPWYWRPFVGALGPLFVRLHAVRWALPLLLHSGPEARAVYDRHLRRRSTRQTVLALERQLGFAPLMERVLAALRARSPPVRLLWGEPDPYFSRPARRALRELLPEATETLLPGGGHFPQEDAPEAFTEALVAYLR